MWQPDPAWTALPGGGGAAPVGVWRTTHEGRPAIVKRFGRPTEQDPPGLDDLRHSGYWRREAEVALSMGVVDGPGLVPPAYLRCEEDEDGVSLWSEEVAA